MIGGVAGFIACHYAADPRPDTRRPRARGTGASSPRARARSMTC